jgi:hypothetical protein
MDADFALEDYESARPRACLSKLSDELRAVVDFDQAV